MEETKKSTEVTLKVNVHHANVRCSRKGLVELLLITAEYRCSEHDVIIVPFKTLDEAYDKCRQLGLKVTKAFRSWPMKPEGTFEVPDDLKTV